MLSVLSIDIMVDGAASLTIRVLDAPAAPVPKLSLSCKLEENMSETLEATTSLCPDLCGVFAIVLAVTSSLGLYQYSILAATCKDFHLQTQQTVTSSVNRIRDAIEQDLDEDDENPVSRFEAAYLRCKEEARSRYFLAKMMHCPPKKLKALKQYRITKMILCPREKHVDAFLLDGRASQGGPIFVTALHISARAGDLRLCETLVHLGAKINPNIFIPNDQMSADTSIDGANKSDGRDFSQYRWGLITPARLAALFGHEDVVDFLKANGGTPGVAKYAQASTSFLSPVQLPRQRLADNECWTNSNETELYYLNSYMDGTRIYPDILYKRS
eukprot:1404781-Rhodomonas_salina.2